MLHSETALGSETQLSNARRPVCHYWWLYPFQEEHLAVIDLELHSSICQTARFKVKLYKKQNSLTVKTFSHCTSQDEQNLSNFSFLVELYTYPFSERLEHKFALRKDEKEQGFLTSDNDNLAQKVLFFPFERLPWITLFI